MKQFLAASWLMLIILGLVAPVSEFGRTLLYELLASCGYSIGVGAIAAMAIAVPALLIGGISIGWPSWILHRPISIAADIVDSVPAILWVLAVVVLADEFRRSSTIVAFSIISMPGAVRVVMGECRRQVQATYFLAGRAIGASAFRLLIHYILRNGTGVFVPYFLQTFGAAVAIDGAIGILGAGNRTDLNLGMMLLRGKEQILTAPWLFVGALLSYLCIFATLYEVRRRWLHSIESNRGLYS